MFGTILAQYRVGHIDTWPWIGHNDKVLLWLNGFWFFFPNLLIWHKWMIHTNFQSFGVENMANMAGWNRKIWKKRFFANFFFTVCFRAKFYFIRSRYFATLWGVIEAGFLSNVHRFGDMAIILFPVKSGNSVSQAFFNIFSKFNIWEVGQLNSLLK